MPLGYLGFLVLTAVVLALLLVTFYWRHLTSLDDAWATKEAHQRALSAARVAEEEVERLRASCASVAGQEELPAKHEEAAAQPARPTCVARSLYVPPGEPLGEMRFVREHLVQKHGWREVPEAEAAAFVLAAGDAPPLKHTCGGHFQGTRIPGPFGRELEVCQKHKLFERLAARLSMPGRRAQAVRPDELTAAWPWLPKTYLLDWPEHLAALNATLPCQGPQELLIVKGDAHGGRAVWLPRTHEELRALLGLPCGGATGPPGPGAAEHPPRLAQELLHSALWDGAAVMSRVFLVAQRRGRVRLSTEQGRWSLGMPAPSYELHMFDTPLLTQYPGRVRDQAAEAVVARRNASEFEAFVRTEAARRGRALPRGWVRAEFMKQAGEIAAEAFTASAAPWAWEMPPTSHAGDVADALKAAVLEPDGAFLFLAAELMLDEELRVRLIEFTCVPQDIHGLEAHFEKLPWTRAFAQDLGVQLARLLLRSSGQDAGSAADSGEVGRWTKLAERGPFPHP